MRTQIFLRVLLALHISGLIIMAGTTVIDYVTFKTFWKLTDQGDNRSLGLIPLMSKYGGLVRTGAAIIILTGIGMLVLVKGVWWELLWFKIKMALVIVLILNGMFVGNRQGLKFRKILADNGPDLIQQTTDLRTNLNRFYIIQLGIFFAIILVSV